METLPSPQAQPQTPDFFPSRPGTHLEPHLCILEAPPEIELSPEEKKEVFNFESQLTYGFDYVDPRTGEVKKVGLEDTWRKKANLSTFYIEYLLTDKGKRQMAACFDVKEEELPTNTEGMMSFLCQFDYEALLKKENPDDKSKGEVENGNNSEEKKKTKLEQLDDLEGESKTFGENEMVKQFESNNFALVDNIPIPTKLVVVRNPGRFQEKVAGFRLLKRAQRKLQLNLQEEFSKNPSNKIKAKLAVLRIHQRKVNELIADLYPTVYALQKQEEIHPTEKGSKALTDISENMVKNFFKSDKSGQEYERQFARLDRFSQGTADTLDEEGNYEVTSKEALALVDDLSQKESEARENIFGVDPRIFENITISADEFKSWAEEVLRQEELLSEYTEYNKDREGKAPDKLWQVVILSSADNLKVEPKQAVLRIPEDFNRTIASLNPAGGVPALDHEITHIYQHENKQRLSPSEKDERPGLTIFKNVGTDRSSVIAEAGAIAMEQKAQEMFGNTREANPHYLAAVKVRLQGGNLAECAQVFYESIMKQNEKDFEGKPEDEILTFKKETAALAFNRAIRLFRNGGDFHSTTHYLTNSQPLVYLEQELLAKVLNENGRNNLLFITRVSVQTLAELHQVGLLDLETIVVPKKRPSEIIMDIIKEKIREAVKQQQSDTSEQASPTA